MRNNNNDKRVAEYADSIEKILLKNEAGLDINAAVQDKLLGDVLNGGGENAVIEMANLFDAVLKNLLSRESIKNADIDEQETAKEFLHRVFQNSLNQYWISRFKGISDSKEGQLELNEMYAVQKSLVEFPAGKYFANAFNYAEVQVYALFPELKREMIKIAKGVKNTSEVNAVLATASSSPSTTVSASVANVGGMSFCSKILYASVVIVALTAALAVSYSDVQKQREL